MEVNALLATLAASLATAGALPVYQTYDPAQFQSRADSFLVVGLRKLTLDTPFTTTAGICQGFTAVVTVTLLMPQDTDGATLSGKLVNTILTALHLAGYGAQEITYGEAAYARQFRRMQIQGDITLSGICQYAQEVGG